MHTRRAAESLQVAERILAQNPPDLGAVAGSVSDRWNTRGAFDIFETPLVDVRMLVPDLDIGPGRPIGTWGAPGGGKNVTVQSIGISVATGRPVFGAYDCAKGRVLHITYDYGAQATSLRYRQLANGMGVTAAELAGQIELAPFPSVNLTSPDALDAFTRKFDGFDFVILDNLRSATGGADENSSVFGTFIQILGTAGEKTGVTVDYLHHTKKNDSGTVDLNSGRGSSAILGASGTVWGIEGSGSEDRKLVHLRAHDMSEQSFEPLWLRMTPGDEGTLDTGTRRRSLRLEVFEEDPAAVTKRKKHQEEQRARVLKAIAENPGIGATELRTKSGLTDKVTDGTVAALLASGEVEDRGTGAARAPRAYHLSVGKAVAA